MKKALQAFESQFTLGRVKTSENLKFHTYHQIDTIPELFFIATTQRELIKAVEVALENNIPYLILGSGTKVSLPTPEVKGLIIKNRTQQIRVVSIKGKVHGAGVGVGSIVAEFDSGISHNRLLEYATSQGLNPPLLDSPPASTLGGAFFYDPTLQSITEKVKVWEQGVVDEYLPVDLNPRRHVVISLFLRLKAS